jgi:hypothetical protein
MRKPSARCLVNTVSLYRRSPTQDADAGEASGFGAALATSVPCSVQPADPERFLDGQTDRLIQKTVYDVIFTTDYSLKSGDKIVWVDGASVSRTLFVLGSADQAGRGSAFVVSAEERR